MRTYGVVAAGSALGALARWGVGLGLPHSPGGLPWATGTVNLTGCLLIGLLLAVLPARAPDHQWLRPFLATGVLGGFTTFSAFAVDVVALADAGRRPVAVAYLLVSVLGGLAGVVGGLVLGRTLVRSPESAPGDPGAGEDRS